MYCTNCGEPLTADQRFCSECGLAVGSTEKPPKATRSRRGILIAGAIVSVAIAVTVLPNLFRREPDFDRAYQQAREANQRRESSGSTRPPNGTTASDGMFGSKYAVSVRDRIDSMARAQDCVALQREFDTAESNGPATMSRTGSNTADLMGYIDGKMRGAGCYG